MNPDVTFGFPLIYCPCITLSRIINFSQFVFTWKQAGASGSCHVVLNANPAGSKSEVCSSDPRIFVLITHKGGEEFQLTVQWFHREASNLCAFLCGLGYLHKVEMNNSLAILCQSNCASFPPRLYENKGEAGFMESLRNLFTSFNDMMNSNSENTGMVKVGWLLLRSNGVRSLKLAAKKCLMLHEY